MVDKPTIRGKYKLNEYMYYQIMEYKVQVYYKVKEEIPVITKSWKILPIFF